MQLILWYLSYVVRCLWVILLHLLPVYFLTSPSGERTYEIRITWLTNLIPVIIVKCVLSITQISKNQVYKLQCSHTNTPDWSLYFTQRFNKKIIKINRRSKTSFVSDYFTNSHNHSSCLCIDIVWRKLMLVILGK